MASSQIFTFHSRFSPESTFIEMDATKPFELEQKIDSPEHMMFRRGFLNTLKLFKTAESVVDIWTTVPSIQPAYKWPLAEKAMQEDTTPSTSVIIL
jgi:hypothetical protein